MKSNKPKDPFQQIFSKIVRGFVSRIIIVIAAGVTLGLSVPYIFEYTSYELPKWFKPVNIIFFVILGIIILIRYAVRVFIILKSGFQNLEQYAEQSMQQQPIDYNIYSVPQNISQGYPQYGYSQYNNQQAFNQGVPPQATGYTNSYSNQPIKQSCRGCSGTAFAIIVIIFVCSVNELIFGGLLYLNKQVEENYYLTTATITSVEKYKTVSEDADGDEHTVTRYHTEYEYEYNGEKYTKSSELSEEKYTGEIVGLYVNPDNPNSTEFQWSEQTKTIMTYAVYGIPAAAIILILLVSIIGKKSRKP